MEAPGAPTPGEIRVAVASEADVVTVCQEGRALCEQLGFSRTETTHVVTAISEVSGNIGLYAGRGEVVLAARDEPTRLGITVVARDSGPGIANVELALQDGYSTNGSMGFGLPGARRLMDDFEIESARGSGTTIRMTRWRPKSPSDRSESAPIADCQLTGSGDGARALAVPFSHGLLLAAVAAVGRRPQAEATAELASEVVQRHAPESPIKILERCHEALRSTGGASIVLASASSLDARMTWLGVGRLNGVLVRAAGGHAGSGERAPRHAGMVGRAMPALRAATLSIARGDTLLLAAGTNVDRPLARARFLRGVRERPPALG